MAPLVMLHCMSTLRVLRRAGVWPIMLDFFYADEVVLTDDTVMPLLAMSRELMVKSIEVGVWLNKRGVASGHCVHLRRQPSCSHAGTIAEMLCIHHQLTIDLLVGQCGGRDRLVQWFCWARA